MSLFTKKTFVGAAGGVLDWKIDCDYLNSLDIDCLAMVVAKKLPFKKVFGVPKGGLALANALMGYTSFWSDNILIVEDVVTTGKTITEFRDAMSRVENPNIYGITIFARGPCPDWVIPVLNVNPDFL